MKTFVEMISEWFTHRGPFCRWFGIRLGSWDFLSLIRLDRLNPDQIQNNNGHVDIRRDQGGYWFPGHIGIQKLCLPTAAARKAAINKEGGRG